MKGTFEVEQAAPDRRHAERAFGALAADLEEPGSKNLLRGKLVTAYNQTLGAPCRGPGLFLGFPDPVAQAPRPMADETPIEAPGSTPSPAAVSAAPVPAAKEPQPEQTYFKAGGGRAVSSKIEVYDFRNPVFLSEVDLRRLRAVHEEFVRYLSARISLFSGWSSD